MTYILALETTEKFGSVALLEGTTLLAGTLLPQDKRSAQTLTVAMDAMLREQNIVPEAIDRVAVVIGPGSFTGLRVGVTAAKIFAFATKAKIVGLKTHEVVAKSCFSEENASKNLPEYISVGVDAQRGDVCAQIFHKNHSRYEPLSHAELIPVADWWKQAEFFENLAFTGPALEKFSAKAPDHVRLLSENLWMPKASIAGMMAAECTEFDDIAGLVPIYSRLSAAEERRKPTTNDQ